MLSQAGLPTYIPYFLYRYPLITHHTYPYHLFLGEGRPSIHYLRQETILLPFVIYAFEGIPVYSRSKTHI